MSDIREPWWFEGNNKYMHTDMSSPMCRHKLYQVTSRSRGLLTLSLTRNQCLHLDFLFYSFCTLLYINDSSHSLSIKGLGSAWIIIIYRTKYNNRPNLLILVTILYLLLKHHHNNHTQLLVTHGLLVTTHMCICKEFYSLVFASVRVCTHNDNHISLVLSPESSILMQINSLIIFFLECKKAR